MNTEEFTGTKEEVQEYIDDFFNYEFERMVSDNNFQLEGEGIVAAIEEIVKILNAEFASRNCGKLTYYTFSGVNYVGNGLNEFYAQNMFIDFLRETFLDVCAKKEKELNVTEEEFNTYVESLKKRIKDEDELEWVLEIIEFHIGTDAIAGYIAPRELFEKTKEIVEKEIESMNNFEENNSNTISVVVKSEGSLFGIKEIEIPELADCCNSKRINMRKGEAYVGSQRVIVDCWENECGHIDKYEDLLKKYSN